MSESKCTTDGPKVLRYAIHDGSQSGSGFFEATVVDTTKPEIVNGKHYQGRDGQYHYESVCECFDREDAKRICDALNAADGRITCVRAIELIRELHPRNDDATFRQAVLEIVSST